MRVGAKVLKIVGGIILQRTVKAITDCIAKGVTDTLKKLVQGTPIEELEKKIKEIESFVADAETRVVAQVTSMVDGILGPMHAKLKALAKDAAFIAELVGMAKQIMNAIRLGACIAGGLETFGVACAVALGDFVLSLFDVSPTDAVAEKLLESCDAQKMMADFLGASDFITSLPNIIAQGLVDKLRPLLPSWAQGLVCDPKDMVVERYRPSDFQCGRGSGAKGDGEGGNGGGGQGPRKGGGTGTKGGGKKGGGNKGGGKKDGGAAKGGSSGTAGDKKKGQSGDQDIKSTTPKPVPPNFKKTHDKQHKFLPISGFPKKDAFTPGMPSTITLLFVDDSSGTLVPIVEVSDIDVVLLTMGEADQHGVHVYEFTFQKEFYVEELNSRFGPPEKGEGPNKASARPR